MSEYVGEGWRRLEVGEPRQDGDEVNRARDEWIPVPAFMRGCPVAFDDAPVRRRVPAATADAATHEPVAWGVQIESGRGLWGHYDYESEARAVCEAVNREEGGQMTVVPLYAAPPALSQPTPEPVAWCIQWGGESRPDAQWAYETKDDADIALSKRISSGTVVPLYAAPPAPHPWCRDVARDLAARGSERREDTVMHRDVPDAIHRLNGLVAGLAERLAEMERKHNGLAELAKLDAGWNRVRDAATAAQDIERITAERDAAIRERQDARRERNAAIVECERLRGQLETLEPIAKAHEAAIKAAEQFNAEQAAKAMTDPASVYRFADAMANGMHAGTAAVMRPIMHALVDQRDAYKARVAELEAAGVARCVDEDLAILASWQACGIPPHWPDDEPETPVRCAESMRREIERLRARIAMWEGKNWEGS